MYSKYDDSNYVPAPGERQRDRLKWLSAELGRIEREAAKIRAEIYSINQDPEYINTLPTLDNPKNT